jgi:galactokinase/mevalonate kinase-like predicted kinase
MRTVVARAPGRVSLAGGGTDIPSYYERHGGAVVSFAIPTSATAVVSERSNGLDLVSLDNGVHELITAERYARRMRHPFLAREFITMQKAVAWHFGLDRARVAAASELAAGAGLASSSAVCAALVAAAGGFIGEPLERRMIAATAARIEMSVLRRPCGKQDAYASAYGGINLIEFGRDGTVAVTPVKLSVVRRRELERHLVLFTNGARRNAAVPLAELARHVPSDKQTMIALGELLETAYLVRTAVERGELRTVGALVDRGWRAKRRLHEQVSTPEIDRVYAIGRDAGALGGKLLGAGLAGAMLFVCTPEQQPELRQVMATQGWRADDVEIEASGATLIDQPDEEATRATRG